MTRAQWYYATAFFIFLMVVIGGLTRLTGSGLSIVSWNLIGGIIPPMTETSWQQVFLAYQESPEYQQIHLGMSLGAFKEIFWLEYIHRLLGRLLFVWSLGGVFYFQFVRREKNWRILWLVPFLIALQGGVGWFMVKSGLHQDPFVSPYRLSLHLVLALGTFTLCLWWGGRSVPAFPCNHFLKPWWWVTFGVGLFTVIWGGFVAGTKAGLLYPTFPKMGEGWLPLHFWAQGIKGGDSVVVPEMIYGTHRLLAGIFTVLIIVGYSVRTWQKDSLDRRIWLGLVVLLAVQIGLGAMTAVSFLDLPYALAHQANAFILVGYLVVLKRREGL